MVPTRTAADGYVQNSRREGYLLVGLTFTVRAYLDGNRSVERLQKIEQLVRRETAEMPVHQVTRRAVLSPGHPRFRAVATSFLGESGRHGSRSARVPKVG